MRQVLTVAVAAGLLLTVAACGGGGGTTSSAPAATTPTAAKRLPMGKLRASGRLQAVVPVGGAPDAPDWQTEGFGSVWVANASHQAVQRIDPATNRVVAQVPVGTEPCDGLASGFGSVWAVDCSTDAAVIRIDPRTNHVAGRIRLTPVEDEGLIAAGEGGIWVMTTTGVKNFLTRIDPSTNVIADRFPMPSESPAAAVGYGAVWVSTTTNGTVERVDPDTGKIIATIHVHPAPRFLAAGEGGVWVLTQADGSVARIDPATNRATTIALRVPGSGGCIAAGEGGVWVTMPGTPISRIDPDSGTIQEKYFGVGGDCISTGFESVWLSNHDLGNVWRIKPKSG